MRSEEKKSFFCLHTHALYNTWFCVGKHWKVQIRVCSADDFSPQSVEIPSC